MKEDDKKNKYICPVCDAIRTAERLHEKIYCRHGSINFLMKPFGVKKPGVKR